MVDAAECSKTLSAALPVSRTLLKAPKAGIKAGGHREANRQNGGDCLAQYQVVK